MSAAATDRLARYRRWRIVLDDPFVELDLSLSHLEDQDLLELHAPLQRALAAMAELERGAIANPDEDRMVGHYWLRAPGLAPEAAIGDEIAAVLQRIEAFAAEVRSGKLTAPGGGRFRHVVLCGIGGSALGPMLLADVFAGGGAAATGDEALGLTVLDNTDPDGIARALDGAPLHESLVLVVSKSGGTPETRNGMLETEAALRARGLELPGRAVAVTTAGSKLDRLAADQGWLLRLPMWDWVGGRTSITSAVGLLPGALLGMDLRAFLAGAAAMDQVGREASVRDNPAAMLAAFWHVQGRGTGERAMVVLPYKDRLLLLSRYLQQLVMESLGKERDRQGNVVNQGIAVYGNKGSTDQHAFVQQLREGRHDFFATFVRVLEDRPAAAGDAQRAAALAVAEDATAGDFLDGFLLGTRKALFDNGRASATLCVDRLDERTLGAVVALFERAVGIYGELVDVNAYHQPGVEAGKQAAAAVLDLQRQLLRQLGEAGATVRELAVAVGADPADCWPILCHLAANGRAGRTGPPDPEAARFRRG